MKKAHTFQPIVDKHIEKYNERYEEHGDNCKALGWPSEADNRKRFEAMSLWLIDWRRHPGRGVTLLDFGCGLGHFYEWLNQGYIDPEYRKVEYTGLDINPAFVAACHGKYPNTTFYSLDILDNSDFGKLPRFDYVTANGVFTEKLDTPWNDHWSYFTAIIHRLWQKTKCGLAFNVMSPVVDEERDDLFHVPFDRMAKFIRWDLSSRHFTFRHDYGLWEYTTYVYRE